MNNFQTFTTIILLLVLMVTFTPLSEALKVKISEVSPTWIPEASTKNNRSVAWVDVIISEITTEDQYKRIVIKLNYVSTYTGICCNSIQQDIENTGLKPLYDSTNNDLIFTETENASYWQVVSQTELQYEIPTDNTQTAITFNFNLLVVDNPK